MSPLPIREGFSASISTLSRGRRVPRETAILLYNWPVSDNNIENPHKQCHSVQTTNMALPLPPGLTPNEVGFLCEMEQVTVIPRQRLEALELLGVSS